MATIATKEEEDVFAVPPQQLKELLPTTKTTNQLEPINKFGSDTIVAKLNNLHINGVGAAAHDDEEQWNNCPSSPQTIIITDQGDDVDEEQEPEDEVPQSKFPTKFSRLGRNLDELVQHNNSVCVDFESSANSDLLNIVSEAAAANRTREGDSEDEDDDDEGEVDELNDKVQTYQHQKQQKQLQLRENRKSEGDGGVVIRSQVNNKKEQEEENNEAPPALPGKRVHNSKSMCDNDLRVDHLINKKDSMRIRFDDNGEAQIQKRDILHRKFYKSVDDELHKKAVASMSSGKSQCMTLDRVFKKLRGQMRKCGNYDGSG